MMSHDPLFTTAFAVNSINLLISPIYLPSRQHNHIQSQLITMADPTEATSVAASQANANEVSLATYKEIADYLERLLKEAIDMPVMHENSRLNQYRISCHQYSRSLSNTTSGRAQQTWYFVESCKHIMSDPEILAELGGARDSRRELLNLVKDMAHEAHAAVVEQSTGDEWPNVWLGCANVLWNLAEKAEAGLRILA